MNSPRILVVDHDIPTSSFLKTLLEEGERFVVELAADVPAAFASIEASPPDLTIIDPALSPIDGFELLRNLRGRPETRLMPILILSARRAPEEKVRGLEAGADDYIEKPVRRDELIARIRTHLRLRRMRDELDAEREALATRGDSSRSQEERRRQLNGMIAADLRAPLTALDLNLDGLRRDLGEAPRPEVERRLAVLQSGVSALARLAAELLDASGLEPIEFTPRRVAWSATTMLTGILEEAAIKTAKREKQMIYRLSDSLPEMSTDPLLVQRSLRAVLAHAVEMTPIGETVNVSVDGSESSIVISIEDSGFTMPGDAYASVFGPDASRRRHSGTFARHGAGMTFARMAAESLGGVLLIEPRAECRGTLYRLAIPVICPVRAEESISETVAAPI